MEDFLMKKLAYIVLVVIILLAISYFVKQETPAAEETPSAPEAALVEDENDGVDAEAISNMTIETENAEIVSDGEVVDEEIEEDNPSETSDDDETIITE